MKMETAEEREEQRQERRMTQEEMILEEKREREIPKVEPTTIKEIIQKFKEEETAVFVNGLGIGRILEVKQEYIIFEITKEEDTDKKRKNPETKKMENYTEKKLLKEKTYIPIAKIDTISEGEKEIPKTNEQAKIDDDLGGL